MRILIHEETGTIHIPKDKENGFMSLCGYNGVTPDARDVWDIGESTWLDDYPEQFGISPSECDKCAKIFNP